MRKLKTKICETCKKEFKQGYTTSENKWKTMKFCSLKCRKQNITPRTIQTKQKMSVSMKKFYTTSAGEIKKKKMSEANSGENHYNWGKHRSKETRLKMSKGHKGINAGEKCHFWRGGICRQNELMKIRRSIEYRLWREAVYARDHWTCQKCEDNKGGNLNPHHIQNFSSCPELRFAIDNGITLCSKCHNKFHKIYLTKNNTKKQLEEFLNNI